MVNCPYCGKEAVMVTSKQFYGRDYKTNIWLCGPCEAYVGTHKNTKTPLGTLAKSKLRQLRKTAHSLVDPMWRSGKMTRTQVYDWIAQEMNIPKDDAHIALFNEKQCSIIIQKALEKRGLTVDSSR